MQIVIDTRQCPCRTLNDKCDIINKECYEDDICSSCPLIRNGGVKLPKGHGDLIDRKEVMKNMEFEEDGYCDFDCYKPITDAQTIIEADTESEEQDADSN